MLVFSADDRISVKGERSRHAVFEYSIIEIPAPGKIEWYNGYVEIKNKSAYQFDRAYIGATINNDVFIRLKEGANVIIQLEDGSEVETGHVSEKVVLSFEIVSPRN